MRHISSRKQSNVLLLVLFLLAGCGGNGEKDQEKGKKKDQKEEKKEEVTDQGETTTSSDPVLPSTLQVATSFQKAGLPYKSGLVLDPGVHKEFVERDRKNLAFGAYSADLSYLVINDEDEGTLAVMTALMKLSDELNISSVFDTEHIAERFQANQDDQDSLVALIIEVQERFDTYVAKNQNRRLRTVAYAGGWTEAMYLASQVGIEDKKNLHLEVEEQMTILQKIIKALERDTKNEEGPVGELLDELRTMEKAYWEDPPGPDEQIPEELMQELKERAEQARGIITKTSS